MSAVRLVVGENLAAFPLEGDLELVTIPRMSGEIMQGSCGRPFGQHRCSSRGQSGCPEETDRGPKQKQNRHRPSLRLQEAHIARSALAMPTA